MVTIKLSDGWVIEVLSRVSNAGFLGVYTNVEGGFRQPRWFTLSELQ